jgi:hypothetical protein
MPAAGERREIGPAAKVSFPEPAGSVRNDPEGLEIPTGSGGASQGSEALEANPATGWGDESSRNAKAVGRGAQGRTGWETYRRGSEEAGRKHRPRRGRSGKRAVATGERKATSSSRLLPAKLAGGLLSVEVVLAKTAQRSKGSAARLTRMPSSGRVCRSGSELRGVSPTEVALVPPHGITALTGRLIPG